MSSRSKTRDQKGRAPRDERAADQTGVNGGRAEVSMGFAADVDSTGVRESDIDGFHQHTALFDRGEFLGELAELSQEPPETRSHVEAESGPRGCKLIVVAGPDVGLEWSFKKSEINIGRDIEHDIHFSDIAVSRLHCRLFQAGPNFFLEDKGSNNGTLLNGVRIEQREMLSPGDELIVGARTLRFIELNVAPATAAAHPIPKAVAQPMLLEPADLPPEPGGSAIEIAEPSTAAPKTFSRRLLAGVALVGLLGAVGLFAMGRAIYRYATGDTAGQRTARARVFVLQGIELVKAQRFGDAQVLFSAVQGLVPEDPRAPRYLAHCEQEIEIFKTLERGRKAESEGRLIEALELAEGVDPKSAYAKAAQELRARVLKALAAVKVVEAARLVGRDDLTGADELIRDVLADYPDLEGAQQMARKISARQAEIEAAAARSSRVVAPSVPKDMTRAVAFYEEARIAEAIDAAEVAGGPNANRYIQLFRRMSELRTDLAQMHQQKAASEMVRVAPTALDLDRRIASGRGRVRRVIESYYADALYLKGLEASGNAEYAKAFRSFSEALRQQPGHKLSETRLADLAKKARDLYYQGFVLRETNADEARRIFRQVVEMTRPEDRYHQWARRWLSANGG